MKNACGFTLVEAILATIILTLPVVGMLALFTRSLAFTESQEPFVVAQYAAEQKMEEILSMDYTNSSTGGILELYTNAGARQETPFAVTGITGMGTVYANELSGMIDPLNRLMRVKIVVCYQNKNGIIGEDVDGDGEWDSGEDTMPTSLGGINGELDSPCQFETVVVNRSY